MAPVCMCDSALAVSRKRWMSEQRERWADGACLCVWVILHMQCLAKALNERAKWEMGRWRLSTFVILCKQCLPKALNERAMRAMGWWCLSVCELRERSEQFICEQSEPSWCACSAQRSAHFQLVFQKARHRRSKKEFPSCFGSPPSHLLVGRAETGARPR